MSKNVIANWIAKQLFKKGGAIATSKSVDFSTDALIKRLSKYNIKPDDITSEDQLLRVLSSVKQAEDNVFNNKFKSFTADVLPFKFKKSFGEEVDSMIKKGEVNVGTADKTPPYKPSKSQTDFEIQEQYRADNAKAIKRFEEKMKKDKPDDMATGGRAGFKRGGGKKEVSKGVNLKDALNQISRSMFDFPFRQRPGYREVYKSLEDIPEEALALMKRDPNFDLQTFLETVKWSKPEKTRFKKIIEYGKYSKEDIPWGSANPSGQYLNYLPFGENESLGEGLLSIKTPSDMDKAKTVMHEMRHSKMKEPWFMKSNAVPKWVQKYEKKGNAHYLDKDIEDQYSQYRDTQKDVSGEELYTRVVSLSSPNK